MIDVTISVDTSKIDRTLADFPVKVAAVKTRALAYIGQVVASRATLAFRTASEICPPPTSLHFTSCD